MYNKLQSLKRNFHLHFHSCRYILLMLGKYPKNEIRVCQNKYLLLLINYYVYLQDLTLS